ncbi:MAG: TonB-dependent receptor, partial [Cellvibrionaceae bacterium]|nr:TonB-dependent receptor [Cellvibrionaceae bacterium]
MSLSNLKRSSLKKTALAAAVSSAFSIGVSAQEQAASSSPVEEVLVKGLRQSIERSMDIKRNSSGVVDSIAAEDLGKFPDLNVAESLQRITGVAIDRSGGEGKQITVRGLGPEYNLVLVNGRQLATESFGREFNFDVLSADLISGADVYKTNRADLQEGGIGATVNLRTARPFDQMGFRFGGSVKGMYETLSEKTAPSAAFLVSNTFADDRFGILFSYSHQERELQSNQVTTSGWRPGQTISNTTIDPETGDPVENILFTNAFIPRNWDQIVDQQKRTRDNAALSIQFAPSEDIAITLDGFISKFEIDSEVTDLAAWFEPGRVGSATIDADTGTLLTFTQETAIAGTSGAPSSDLVSHTRNSEDVNNRGFGLNIEWAINDLLTAKFDASTSSAKNDRAGNDRFSVVGILGDYAYDGTGRYPTVTHEVFANGLPDASLSRMHYNEIGNKFSDEDEITELKADFVYTPDSSVFQEAKFGAYHQEREKSAFQIFGSQCQFCGYGTAA